ncbi:hypothetical protein [Aliiruegeria lutimaris]|uniref:Uncharacterized protein n=1 Tax=Aliiruegeria lutimaris TaxID=571298 RepID=A0A1G8IL72_9RHOB|nr:hypothetical protein [Aliiruegeria lutimaris]SDI19655.1 hypothetical protein SAMN04488026_100167 [Aliiruegeria lutimaris]
MFRTFLLPAILTGVFCAVFAVGVDYVLPPLIGLNVAIIAAISGFCGSLFARGVLREHEGRK